MDIKEYNIPIKKDMPCKQDLLDALTALAEFEKATNIIYDRVMRDEDLRNRTI